MAVLFDASDEYVRSVLDVAKVRGEIGLADLEAVVEAGVEARDSISTDDIADTIEALAKMGVEIDSGLTQEQEDAEFLQAILEWPGPMPSLSGEELAKLMRAMDREKAAREAQPDPSRPSAAEEAAARREILSKRTFVQNLFAEFGPRIRRE